MVSSTSTEQGSGKTGGTKAAKSKREKGEIEGTTDTAQASPRGKTGLQDGRAHKAAALEY